MKIGIVGDIHWSRYSSIVRLRGKKYSYRLENCIQSINWAEALLHDCDKVVYLGDFFDSAELNSEEITAMKEIIWNSVPHYFLVGNHELGINDLSYSSSHVFSYINLKELPVVVDSVRSEHIGNISLHFIPYLLTDDKSSISSYLDIVPGNKNIIFSHNDIAGIQLGKYLSTKGFNIEDIQNNCDLFLNGHLHNGTKVAERVINIGNLTGQNFSEDAFKYDHCAFILDTDTLQCAVYENPYAINFYKINVCDTDVALSDLKQNAVVTLKTRENTYDDYKYKLDNADNVLTSRIIIVPDNTENTTHNQHEIISINHLDKFKEYVLSTLGNSEVVKEELDEVLQ